MATSIGHSAAQSIAHTVAPTLSSKINWFQAGRHATALAAKVMDQPAIVSGAYQMAPLGYGAIAGITTAKDLQAAKSQGESTQALLRNGLVMGVTSIVTLLAARKWMGNPHTMAEVLQSRGLLKKSVAALKASGQPLVERLKNATQALSKSMASHSHDHGHDHGIDEAVSFLKVGTASVATATATGLMANALDSRKTHWQRGEQAEHILQESVFQYLANIALCGFALGGAAKAANALGWTKAKAPLQRSALLASGLGLSVGLGGMVANWIGRRAIDPVTDWVKSGDLSLSSLQFQLDRAARGHTSSRRHIEAQDLILHLDDAPLLFNALGSKLFEPMIQLFFMPSAYRIGSGYRSEKSTSPSPAPHGAKGAALQASRFLAPTMMRPLTPYANAALLPSAISFSGPLTTGPFRSASPFVMTAVTLSPIPPMLAMQPFIPLAGMELGGVR